jgi:hypothetical protein
MKVTKQEKAVRNLFDLRQKITALKQKEELAVAEVKATLHEYGEHIVGKHFKVIYNLFEASDVPAYTRGTYTSVIVKKL